jgi:hypothetical protein
MKIGSYLVVARGEGDRYLKKALDKLTTLVDFICIWGDDIDDKTKKICLSYPNVELYNHNKSVWGRKQWAIKEKLYSEMVLPKKPDWVVCIDADEVLDDRLTREKLEELANRDEVAFEFYCVQLWDKENQMRTDDLWGNFYNVRFFKCVPEMGSEWKKTALHCGLAPMYAYQYSTECEYIFKHYGYMKHEDRIKKDERYKKFDPDARYISERYYKSILEEKGVRLKEFDESKFIKRLKYIKRQPKVFRIMPDKKETSYVFKILKNGRIMTINDRPLYEEWINKKNDFEFLGTLEQIKEQNIAKKVEQSNELLGVDLEKVEKKEELVCEICGFKAKTENGLKVHMRKHNEN